MGDFVTVRISDTTTKYGKELVGKINALALRSVSVGFFGERHYIKENGKDVDFVKVAARHEFGTINQRLARKYDITGEDLFPNARMDASADIIEETQIDTIKQMTCDYIDGKFSITGLLHNIGKLARDVMRSVFKNNPTFKETANSEYRKELDKGFRKNIEYEIVSRK